MNLHIARLQLRLPAGYEGRASGIAHAIAEALARQPLGKARRIDVLHVGPVAVAAGASDQDVVATVVHGMAERLQRTP